MPGPLPTGARPSCSRVSTCERWSTSTKLTPSPRRISGPLRFAVKPIGGWVTYERALIDLDLVGNLDPKLGYAIAVKAEIHRQQGDYERALAEFHQAIALEPKDWSLYDRALTYRAMRQEAAAAIDLIAAIDWARQAEARVPDDWQNRLNLARYYLASGDHSAAEGRYQAAIDARVNAGLVRVAIRDLDDYLHLFPDRRDGAARCASDCSSTSKSRFPDSG